MTHAPAEDPILLEAERRRREKASALGVPDAATRPHKIRGPHVAKLDAALDSFKAEADARRETPRAPERSEESAPAAEARPARDPSSPTPRRRRPRRRAQRREERQGGKPFEAEDAFALELEAAAEEPHYRDTILPAGATIEAAFVSVVDATIEGGARKWLALFRVVQVLAPHDDLIGGGLILRAWNPPSGRWLSPRHNLSADWLAVVGRPIRTLPRRYTANALLGSFLRGVTVTALTRIVDSYHDPKTKTTVPQAPYSVIDKLLGRAAGTPRVLERRGVPS